MPGDVQRLKLLAGPHPAMFSHKRNLYGTAWLSCMSGTSSPRDELSSTGATHAIPDTDLLVPQDHPPTRRGADHGSVRLRPAAASCALTA